MVTSIKIPLHPVEACCGKMCTNSLTLQLEAKITLFFFKHHAKVKSIKLGIGLWKAIDYRKLLSYMPEIVLWFCNEERTADNLKERI